MWPDHPVCLCPRVLLWHVPQCGWHDVFLPDAGTSGNPQCCDWGHKYPGATCSHPVSWKKFYSVSCFRHHGRNAKQSCGFLCVLFLERNWNLQVSLLHALLHWHGLEGAHVAPLHYVDSVISPGMFVRSCGSDPVHSSIQRVGKVQFYFAISSEDESQIFLLPSSLSRNVIFRVIY